MKIRDFFTFKPLGELFYNKPNFDAFYGTNMSLTVSTFYTEPIHSTASFSELGIFTPFYMVFYLTYVNNSTTKLPILAKIGVRVQQWTSRIWKSPASLNLKYNRLVKYIWRNNRNQRSTHWITHTPRQNVEAVYRLSNILWRKTQPSPGKFNLHKISSHYQ